jgi:hypothetical protein
MRPQNGRRREAKMDQEEQARSQRMEYLVFSHESSNRRSVRPSAWNRDRDLGSRWSFDSQPRHRPTSRRSWSFFELSPGKTEVKLLRTPVIIGIILVSTLLIRVLERFSRFSIFGDHSFLKYVFHQYKSRTQTIPSVVLNDRSGHGALQRLWTQRGTRRKKAQLVSC